MWREIEGENKLTHVKLRQKPGIEDITVLQRNRLRLYGHVSQKVKNDWVLKLEAGQRQRLHGWS